MGCLKNIIKTVILIFAVIGFISVGGPDFFVKKWNEFMQPSKEVIMEKAQKVGDFSQISDEFEIDKAASMLGYNGVLAEHKASGQKMIVVNSGKKYLLTKKDFDNNNIEEKLETLRKKFKYSVINVEDLKITKKGYIKAFEQNSPYVKFKAKINNIPSGNVEGIISAVETKNGDSKIIISINEDGKYSQLIAQEFFRKVK